jgi:hypothetical protein
METEKRRIFISSTLRSRVNRLAHELALQHENTIRTMMISELEKMVKDGMALEAQHHYLDMVSKLGADKYGTNPQI